MRERLGRPANRTELVQDAEGEFHISWSRKSEDAQVEPNWYGMVTRHDAPYWQIAVQILQTSTGPSAKGKLAQRFLDGLAWYGDAVSEQSEAGKLVRFVVLLNAFFVCVALCRCGPREHQESQQRAAAHVLGVGAKFRHATVEGRERSVHQVGTARVYLYARCEVFSEAFLRALAR